MFFLTVKWLALRAGQRQGGVFRLPPPYLWTPLSPQRVKGCSPLTIPKKKSKPKNASRFAKTGCGAQRPLRALSGTRVLLTAAPTAPPCIRRRRRSSLLRIFLCFSHLRLRRRFHASAGRYRQQRGNTSCEAANRRNEKKAFSEAASFFPFRQLLRGLKGASSPFLATATTAACGGYREELLGQRPAGCERQRSRRWEPQPVGSRASKVAGAFLVLFWRAKENISLNEIAIRPAHRRARLLKKN